MVALDSGRQLQSALTNAIERKGLQALRTTIGASEIVQLIIIGDQNGPHGSLCRSPG